PRRSAGGLTGVVDGVPQAPGVPDPLTGGLTRRRVPDAAIKRPPVVGDLERVGAPGGPDQRLVDSAADHRSRHSGRESGGRPLGRAITFTGRTPRMVVGDEEVQREPVAVDENGAE